MMSTRIKPSHGLASLLLLACGESPSDPIGCDGCAQMLRRWPIASASGSSLGDTYVPQQVTIELLRAFLDAFNRHDLDAIMTFFAEECVFYMPRGVGPRGDQYVGKVAVRAGLAKRFEGIPDVHYGEDSHWVGTDFGVSEWTLTGTPVAGPPIRVRGVDLLEFANGKITRKDSFWKLLQ